MDEDHFNRPQLRDATFIKPPNIIKAKVGDGGLSDAILNRAQAVLEQHAKDFKPLAEIYLDQMQAGINEASEHQAHGVANENEEDIAKILFPCVQLKANGAMFQYPLVTRIAQRFVQFMEVVERLDQETLEIATAFHKTIKIVINAQIKGDGGEQGDALVEELNNACKRYLDKHAESINFDK